MANQMLHGFIFCNSDIEDEMYFILKCPS